MSWLSNPKSELVMIQGKFMFRFQHCALWSCGSEWVLTASSFRGNEVNSHSYLRVASNTPWMCVWKVLWDLVHEKNADAGCTGFRCRGRCAHGDGFHLHLSFLPAHRVSLLTVCPHHATLEVKDSVPVEPFLWGCVSELDRGEALQGRKRGWDLLLFLALLPVSCLGDHWQNSSDH